MLEAASAISTSSSLETLSRPFLDLMHRLTGLESTYLTEVRAAVDEQQVLFSDNRGRISIPEGLTVPWHDTLCRQALETGRRSTSDVETDLPDSAGARGMGLKTYVSVPIVGVDDQLMGTLCGASGERVPVSSEAVEVMALLARLMADQWERDRVRYAAVLRADEAEARMRQRASFLAVAEHKLKSPLALLRGWSDLLVDQWPEMEDEVRNEALQTMQEASRDALSQVDELLLEARAEVLSHELQPVPVDLGQLVPQVARQLQGAATPEQRVVGHVAASEAVVLADRQALWQVLWHLGENAIKYSPDGGLIELRVDSAPGRQVVLTVTDEGLGVPTDIDVFAPFSRGTSEQQGNIKGTGLGLHIVHNLLDAMSGTVTAERRETRGSVFRVTLPLMA